MKKTKIIYLSRKLLAAAVCALAAGMMFWVVNNPAVVGAAATTRQLPIYCVQKDYKVLSISFDAAWGNVILRTLCIAASCSGLSLRFWSWRNGQVFNGASAKENE